jgi:class 3 adenylate cyclase
MPYLVTQDGPDAAFIGVGDHHDTGYDSHEQSKQLFDPGQDIVQREKDNDHCFYTLHVYPSSSLKGIYTSNGPFLYTVIVAAVMLATGIAFYGYELLVQRRQKIVLDKVERTTAIVTSLFPDTVRDRILNDDEPFTTRNKKDNMMLGKLGLKYFLDENAGERADYAAESKPIADLFPHTTVMFADISGFTAWSSVREPAQVFTLLETIYQSFDKIARKRRVFKVETVGDCYVAVCGLPEPRKDHAVVMALFARDCMKKMGELVKQLELTLGPDTGDLANRFGLHSGACTAGVLRGERARFQLFGDTVNTAARMESTGQRDKIHVSQETADLIISAGKKHWLEERRDIIVAKGKGALQTYWLNPNDEEQDTVTVEELVAKVEAPTVDEVAKKQASVANQKLQRLIDWNCELLTQNLKKIMARRQAEQKVIRASVTSRQAMAAVVFGKESDLCTPGNCLSEIVEIIRLPQFKSSGDAVDPKEIQLNETVQGQLRDFCSILASLYKDNQFHCFEVSMLGAM